MSDKSENEFRYFLSNELGVIDANHCTWSIFDVKEAFDYKKIKLQAEREKVALLQDAVESYASFEDGKYYGPSDIYEDIGEVARKALGKLKELEGKE